MSAFYLTLFFSDF